MMARFGALVALCLAACTADDSVLETGVVAFHDHPGRIVVPATARVGVPITIEVSTFGDGCIEREETRIEASGGELHVTPVDRRQIPGPNEGCTQILLEHRHEAEATFSRSGTATVVVHGRRVSRHVNRAVYEPIEQRFAIAVEP